MATASFYPGQSDYIAKLNSLWDRVAGVGQLVDGATIDVNISDIYRVYEVTLGGNRTINFTGRDASGNSVALGNSALLELDGRPILLRIKQDVTGSRVPTLGTMVRFGTDLGSITFTTTAAKTDRVALEYHHTAGKVDVIAFARGF